MAKSVWRLMVAVVRHFDLQLARARADNVSTSPTVTALNEATKTVTRVLAEQKETAKAPAQPMLRVSFVSKVRSSRNPTITS
jgi:hypothetical protein